MTKFHKLRACTQVLVNLVTAQFPIFDIVPSYEDVRTVGCWLKDTQTAQYIFLQLPLSLCKIKCFRKEEAVVFCILKFLLAVESHYPTLNIVVGFYFGL